MWGITDEVSCVRYHTCVKLQMDCTVELFVIPVKTVLQEISKSCKKYANLARFCTKSCKSCTKNEAFLARYENLAR